VLADEGKARLVVLDLPARLEAVGRVAGGADAERLLVRVLVAVVAGAELRDPVVGRLVTRRARGGGVGSGQRIGGLRMVEGLDGLLEGHRRRVAAGAVRPEPALVHVVVARRAGGPGGQERAALVAGLAPGGQRRVLAVEGEPGLLEVVELLRVEGTQLRLHAGVLDVAGDAVALDVAVHALLRRDPLGNRLVAGEALLGRDLAARLVALLAVVEAFELRVRLRELAGRNQVAEVLPLASPGRGEERRQAEKERRRREPSDQGPGTKPHRGPPGEYPK